MYLRGKLYAESPIYRGNARKTLFTRDADGKQRLVSLAGEIEGTAQSLMDAFVGASRNGRNVGLLNQLWDRLYDQKMPGNLITKAECHLQEQSYPEDRFFDLRMGIRLDEDRWSVEANANYKMETIFRNSAFDFLLQVNDQVLKQGDNQGKLYYLLQELIAGRFWYGAGKSKGMGHTRLELELSFSPQATPELSPDVNHLTITCRFDATNPMLVGWNWGKIDPDVPAFAAVEGRILVESMRTMPAPISERLKLSIGGPILSPEDWKSKLATMLPRVIAIWLREQSIGSSESWTLPGPALEKLGKGKKHALSKKVIASVQSLVDTPFPSKEAAQSAIAEALGKRANMAKRIVNVMVQEKQEGHRFNQTAWEEIAEGLRLDPALGRQLEGQIEFERELTATLSQACSAILPELTQQVDRQIRLLQSDNWVDVEIDNRREHVKIKEMLRDRKIRAQQWDNYNQAPDGITPAVWREFLASHRRVRYQHMTNERNLNKSITNDRNFIDFLETYRDRTRQELAQPKHTSFRAGGRSKREVSRQHGHPYDTVFMRLFTWKPSAENEGAWEAYVPGSTIKGAFRRRASQVLKTLWGESRRTDDVIDWLFGRQGQVGRIFFSDAYLVDPDNTERAWCSMDGIRIDPKTGEPIESAKLDFLYAYGEQLKFQLRLDVKDIGRNDMAAYAVFQHLLQDFQRGDIPLGGEKTSGMGWVTATIENVHWLAANTGRATENLFPGQSPKQEGIWETVMLADDSAVAAMRPTQPLVEESVETDIAPPRASAGFISHRSFGGYCGMLYVEAEVVRSIHIQESGEPSYTTIHDGEPVNGWDTFSMTSPDAALRGDDRVYALPSRSLKGMLRHIYAIASNSKGESAQLENLNSVDSLFGWVGSGQNQAIMGRVSISFGTFEQPELSWFKVPNFYSNWRYTNGRWEQAEKGPAQKLLIDKSWRVFPHAPLAPVAQRIASFAPDTTTDQYLRAILPGSRAHFNIRFWNLEEAELQRFIWCVGLEDGLGHKIGKNRYIGFGSLRTRILPESYLTDWVDRYASNDNQGKTTLDPARWHNPSVIHHYNDLRNALKL